MHVFGNFVDVNTFCKKITFDLLGIFVIFADFCCVKKRLHFEFFWITEQVFVLRPNAGKYGPESFKHGLFSRSVHV